MWIEPSDLLRENAKIRILLIIVSIKFPVEPSNLNIKYDPHKHIPTLDGVRGLAILLVLVFHLYKYIYVTNIGWIGVDLFFVLSGFLITGILLNAKATPNFFLNFISRRALRIFPLYYLFLFLFFIVLPALNLSLYIDNFEYLSENQIWFWTYTQNWLGAFSSDWINGSIISHFWSLAIEEQFYLFWPFIIYFNSKKSIVRISIVIIFMSIILRNIFIYFEYSWVTSYIFTLSRLDNLAIGALCAVLVRDGVFVKILNRYIVYIMMISFLIVIFILVYTRNLSMSNIYFLSFGYTVLAILFACIILFSLSEHRFNLLKTVFNNPIMIFFGKYSYGLYVYHIPAYMLLYPKLNSSLQVLTNFEIINSLIASTLIFIIVVIVSLLSYHFVEVKFLKLKKYFHPAQPKVVVT